MKSPTPNSKGQITSNYTAFSKGISLYTGRAKGTEASHLDGYDRQHHLWDLLGHRHNTPYLREYLLLQAQSQCNSYCAHHDHVQLRCQSVCICSDKPTIQGEDEGYDMLQLDFFFAEGSPCEGTTGHRVGEHQHPANRHSRTMFQGVMSWRQITTPATLVFPPRYDLQSIHLRHHQCLYQLYVSVRLN